MYEEEKMRKQSMVKFLGIRSENYIAPDYIWIILLRMMETVESLNIDSYQKSMVIIEQ